MPMISAKDEEARLFDQGLRVQDLDSQGSNEIGSCDGGFAFSYCVFGFISRPLLYCIVVVRCDKPGHS
jgi:hypothetical protein